MNKDQANSQNFKGLVRGEERKALYDLMSLLKGLNTTIPVDRPGTLYSLSKAKYVHQSLSDNNDNNNNNNSNSNTAANIFKHISCTRHYPTGLSCYILTSSPSHRGRKLMLP